jgi:hypothetical protein
MFILCHSHVILERSEGSGWRRRRFGDFGGSDYRQILRYAQNDM